MNKPIFSYDNDDLEPLKKKEEDTMPEQNLLETAFTIKAKMEPVPDEPKPKLRKGSLPDNWEDRGETKLQTMDDGKKMYKSHVMCNTRLHIGIDINTNEPFLFCPMCRIKVGNF